MHRFQQRSERLLSIIDHIDKHFHHKLLLEDIADRQGLTMTYLSHLFKEAFGVTFQDYLKEKRFDYARELLSTTSRSITDISVSSGFSDVRYLTKLFRERMGCTPSEYRMRNEVTNAQMHNVQESLQHIFTSDEGLMLIAQLREELRSKLSKISLLSFLDQN